MGRTPRHTHKGTIKFTYVHITHKYTQGHECTHIQMHVIAQNLELTQTPTDVSDSEASIKPTGRTRMLLWYSAQRGECWCFMEGFGHVTFSMGIFGFSCQSKSCYLSVSLLSTFPLISECLSIAGL